VENVSLGLSVCAERNAIAAAVCAGMLPGQLQEVVVVADTKEAVRPCGACRQVIAEFAAPDCTVTCMNLRKASCSYRWDELMPLSFGREK
jgi:cytidine deaminase